MFTLKFFITLFHVAKIVFNSIIKYTKYVEMSCFFAKINTVARIYTETTLATLFILKTYCKDFCNLFLRFQTVFYFIHNHKSCKNDAFSDSIYGLILKVIYFCWKDCERCLVMNGLVRHSSSACISKRNYIPLWLSSKASTELAKDFRVGPLLKSWSLLSLSIPKS